MVKRLGGLNLSLGLKQQQYRVLGHNVLCIDRLILCKQRELESRVFLRTRQR